jgi:hypothetical protein
MKRHNQTFLSNLMIPIRPNPSTLQKSPDKLL